MKRVLLITVSVLILSPGLWSQSVTDPFFEQVTFIGAFDGSGDWTQGWAEWNPVNKDYPAASVTKGNGQFSRSTGLHIKADENWSGVIKLDGWVYIDNGATLTINAGTIVRGTAKSGLFIERGGKLKAVGTQTQPVVFTSNQAAGLRAQSDWAGIILCGKAPNNLAGGEGIAEGGIESPYGGTDVHDNSGEMRYVRIEFPGYEVATGSEVNGLTFCSVGDGTRIEYIQISYSGDDGFEWFGGTVNAKHIISYKTEDDDFDTDNGFSGLVQFGLISRDPQISDTDTGNAFESDNDASGSVNQPFTKGVFSNISAFGPYASKSLVLAAQHEDGSAMRLRRSTRLQIFNSLFAGWGNGIRMESDNTMNAAKEGILNMKNCIIAGDKNKDYRVSGTVFDVIALQNWYLTPAYKNKMLTSNADALITGPFNYAGPNFQPASGSPVFNASGWVTTTAEEFSRYPQITDFSGYPNPFSKTTTIQVTVAETSGASLVVCNLSGMPVARLHSGLLYPGSYRFPFDATNLPGGIYLARFTGNGPGKTLKLMVK